MARPVPPFYENFDNTHCVQAVLRSVLAHFEPHVEWTWEELDTMTGKEPGKWTWPFRYPAELVKRGYDIHCISDTDLEDYRRKGIYQTLADNLGKEAADRQREMANLEDVWQDFETYDGLLKKGSIIRELRVPTRKDIESLLEQGFLLRVALNACVLNDREGYASHSVLVYDIDEQFVYMQDSGGGVLGFFPERRVAWDKFLHACKTPTLKQFVVVAYRKKNA